jgi:hypothetical protein
MPKSMYISILTFKVQVRVKRIKRKVEANPSSLYFKKVESVSKI